MRYILIFLLMLVSAAVSNAKCRSFEGVWIADSQCPISKIEIKKERKGWYRIILTTDDSVKRITAFQEDDSLITYYFLSAPSKGKFWIDYNPDEKYNEVFTFDDNNNAVLSCGPVSGWGLYKKDNHLPNSMYLEATLRLNCRIITIVRDKSQLKVYYMDRLLYKRPPISMPFFYQNKSEQFCVYYSKL